MATYRWKKYNISATIGTFLYDHSGDTEWQSHYKSYAWDGDSWEGSGSQIGVDATVTAGQVAYKSSGNWIYKYVAKETVVGTGPLIDVATDFYVAPRYESGTQTRGGYISDVTSTSRSAYPDNGISGSYWYVYQGMDNSAPTTPGAFTTPTSGTVLKGGADRPKYQLAWGKATDYDGNPLTYRLERNYFLKSTNAWNGWAGSSDTVVTDNTNAKGEFTAPSNTDLIKVQFRVVANDGTVNSNWATSSIYDIGYNNAPTITINTTDNFTLSESAGENQFTVEGTAKDVDANNTVTIKAQINDGTVRNIGSALSDGSTSIPFSKVFSYSDKKVYDGVTPLTVDLAEGVDHNLKVWAEDDQGGKSTIVERTFRVIHNRPPVINGADSDLGPILQTPSIIYQVGELEGQAINVTEKINGQVIRTFEATPATDYTVEIPIGMWIPLQLQQHTLTIEAIDSVGAKSTRTYTFTRTEDRIVLELKNPFLTDVSATRILVTPDVYLPVGSDILIEACNNAFDAAPTWEDITSMAMNKRGFSFTNTTKTAADWGINIRFTLLKGTATEEVRLNGFGGAFD